MNELAISCSEDVVEMLDGQWKTRFKSEDVLTFRLRSLLVMLACYAAPGMMATMVLTDDASLIECVCCLERMGLAIRVGPEGSRWKRTVLGEYVVARMLIGDDWT